MTSGEREDLRKRHGRLVQFLSDLEYSRRELGNGMTEMDGTVKCQSVKSDD